VYLDGGKLNLETYVVGVYRFVKLRDLAAAVNFGVDYLAQRDAILIDTTTGYKPPVTSDGLQITMIGDSLGIGVEPYLKKLLPKLDNNSKVSRQFHHAKAVAQELLQKGRLAPTVIIQLGTNGTVKESDMRALIELIGTDRKIVFVNCQVPRSWSEGNNKTFAKVVPDYPNTIIADWYSVSLDKNNYFAKDGVHPAKTGATVLARVIADAVLAIQ
jgi:lysophospholipase L1-like esterase